MSNILNPLCADFVSVIIPCYNQGKYLVTAIESVLAQTYSNYEIILIDDGSGDTTQEVAKNFAGVKYIYQSNAGLSAARNKGIENALGNYLVFLDADDWLLPDALKINLSYFVNKKEIAFVAGGFELLYEAEHKTWIIDKVISDNHYSLLLEQNYIAMHATVMYQRWVFDLFKYDTSLRSCEDYDLYLKITRSYPIVHHAKTIAVYRIHNENMSGNFKQMLETALLVLKKQEPLLLTDNEKENFKKGMAFWKLYYAEKIYNTLRFKLYDADDKIEEEDVEILKKYQEPLFKLYLQEKERITKAKKLQKKQMKYVLKSAAKKYLPLFLFTALKKVKQKLSDKPENKKINFGNLTTEPFSRQFGYDRGGPIDRYYIENFLQKNATSIKGRVLEIGDNEYTLQFGNSRVTKSDILHVTTDNPKASFVGDLSNAPYLPDSAFDCIILTQTLHFIYDFKSAVKTCYRILKPGGSLLLTVPGISHISNDQWAESWYWAFTDKSIKKILSEEFPSNQIEIEFFGNVFVAAAFLYGAGSPEIQQGKLDYTDPNYQLIITAAAVKPH